MPTILLTVPFGQAVRDVLRTDTFAILRGTPGVKLVILSQGASDESFVQEFGAPNVHHAPLYDYSPTHFERLVRSFHLAMLRHKSSTIQMYSSSSYGGGLRWLAPLADLSLRLMGEARLRSTVGWIMLNLPPAGNYRHIFTRYRPDLVVVTRVLGSSPDYLVLKQAARRKVPVVALVSSWDNFTSKGFFPFGVQWLVVWNDIMRQEAIELFGFPPDRIFVSGIPRFDHYFRREGMRTRAQFFADLGLDPEKRLITFATGNKNLLVGPQDPTSPEPEIAEFLADAIDQGVLGYPAQLLVRLHPLADLTAYSKLWHRQGVTLQVPGNRSAFRDRLFSKVDEVELGETMWHSDVVVNIASTITIDAAVFDTPVVCIGFDMRGERPYLESVRRFYDYEHYRKLTKTGGFRIAWSKSELLDQIRLYLKDPSRDRDNRLKIVQQQCQYVDGRAGERVAMYLLEILSCMGAL